MDHVFRELILHLLVLLAFAFVSAFIVIIIIIIPLLILGLFVSSIKVSLGNTFSHLGDDIVDRSRWSLQAQSIGGRLLRQDGHGHQGKATKAVGVDAEAKKATL